jgi:iron complex outermembrane receptor protein
MKQIISCMLSMLLISSIVMAQQPTSVTGVVKDEAGEPVVGTVVMVKGNTNQITVTDINGAYSLSSVAPNTVLVFSCLGFVTLEVERNGRSVVNVVLRDDVNLLDEVVVIGYGQVKKGDATGSVTAIKADLDGRGHAPNAQTMMIGKIAGVAVTNDGGSPTGGATIRIRGGSSLSASNSPLIVIDGVPIGNEGVGGVGNIMGAINPTDIETFTVLKDASATAIYGSRASNGVIIITTKKGVAGKLRITYDGNVSMSTPAKKIDVLSGDEFRDFVKKTFAGRSNEAEVVGKLGKENTDWQNEIYRTTINTEHNLSLFGSAKDVMPYRVSFGYNNLNGILKTSSMERYTGSFALSPSLLKNDLKVNLNGKFLYSNNVFANTGAIGAAVAFDPTQPVYEKNSPYGGFWSWLGANGMLNTVAGKNPVSILDMHSDKATAFNFIGNAQFDYRLPFLNDLHLNLNMGMDYSHSSGHRYASEWSPSEWINGGFDGNWDQDRRNSLLDFYAQYKKDLDFLNSNIDIMGGYSWQHYWVKGSNQDYRISKFDEFGKPQVVSINSYENEHYLVSFFGRINYSIDNKYLFTFTLRDDGSSRFHPDRRWGLFPSAALAWKISDEGFMSCTNSVMNSLKLRLGWGKTGQQDINQGDYPYMGQYQYSVGEQASYIRGYDANGNPIWSNLIRPLSYNEHLTWETTTTYNVGIDYGFLNNRIYGSIDAYYRETKDLINAETKVAAGTNFSEYVAANIGSLKNQGVEFSVLGVVLEAKDLRWEIGGNFAYNKNEIISLSYGENTSSIRRYGHTGGDGGFQLMVHSVGNPAGMYYVYQQIYDANGKPIEGFYKDRNNDGQINEQDLYMFHKPAPDWTFGFNTKLVWKAWDLSIAGHGSVGNYNFNAVAANNAEVAPPRVYANEFLQNRVRCAFEPNFQYKQVLSDYYVQDASFVRVDNITLGWSFKKSQRLPLSGRIYGSVQNPFVITKYKGLDPEVFGGVDSNFYPRPLTGLLGVNINF